MHIFLGLGTNLGDRHQNLLNARDLLMKEGVMVVGQSEILETAPLGGLDQPMYLNQVLECMTELQPDELFLACKRVEKSMGRDVELPSVGNVSFGDSKKKETKEGEARAAHEWREARDWKSRVIDIDILFYGDRVEKTDWVTIPHARMQERDFLIEGMQELAPDFVHPVLNKKMHEF